MGERRWKAGKRCFGSGEMQAQEALSAVRTGCSRVRPSPDEGGDLLGPSWGRLAMASYEVRTTRTLGRRDAARAREAAIPT